MKLLNFKVILIILVIVLLLLLVVLVYRKNIEAFIDYKNNDLTGW